MLQCTLLIAYLLYTSIVHSIPVSDSHPAATNTSAPFFTAGQRPPTAQEEYVVILDPAAPHPSSVLSRIDLTPSHPSVRHTFDNSAFRGFTASMHAHSVSRLHGMADVMHVERVATITAQFTTTPNATADAIVRSGLGPDAPTGIDPRSASAAAITTRPNSPWGLQRISSASPSITGDTSSLSYDYSYTDARLGAGVDIYVVDTGINVAHVVFGGRARTGFSFEADGADGNGHGTHVAGTAAGAVFGVASEANLVAVKVLGADGSGTSADTLAGLDYVVRQHEARRADEGFAGSVMSLSWGLSSTSSAINSAILAAASLGIHVSLAAGNSASDACLYSPSSSTSEAQQPLPISVGSVGPSSSISSFSNTGRCVSVYAPGESVLSAWIDSPVTINELSGTSMACPHVTGVMAVLLAGAPELAVDVLGLRGRVLGLAVAGVVRGADGALLVGNGVRDGSGGAEGILT